MSDDDFTNDEGAVAAELDRQATPADPRKGPVLSTRDKTERKLAAGGGGMTVRTMRPQIRHLPPDAPVRALGTFQNKLYFLDSHSQLRELAAKDVGPTMILHLFGAENDWLYRLWPTLRKVEDMWVTTGWEGKKAQEAMITACARKGIWRPQDYVRGRGTWNAGGKLVVHAGGRLHVSDGTTERPGLIGQHVYPAAPRALEPALPDDDLDGRAASAELLDLIGTWNWKREFDARLLLGFTVAAMMGGALKVRPLVWVTGEKGAGKSSLIGEDGVIHHVFGSGILMTANTTAAGLYQKIEYDSLPVAIDEIEAKRGNQKTEAVIELARQAYSGGMVLRGGADHEGKEFRAKCSVLFGSILIPPLMPQDLSRLALLNLEPFPSDAKEPTIDPTRLHRIGRVMLRRVLDKWADWPDRVGAWHGFLRGLGHSGRAADQFGTLLAAADLMLSDGVPTEDEMAAVAGGMSPVNLKETQVESTNAARCIGYAMSRPLDAMRGGERMMVSELVTCAVRRYGGEMDKPLKPQDAVRHLERAGVSVLVVRPGGARMQIEKPNKVDPVTLDGLVDREDDGTDAGVFVGFAPDGDGILELFRGSDWEGVAGAHNPYVQALERVTGARKAPGVTRIGMRPCRPVMIPLRQCIEVPSTYEVQTGNGYDQ